MKQKLILPILLVAFSLFANATISVTSLKTEGMTNPLGIDALKPRFSWKTEATSEQNVLQKTYKIPLAKSDEKLAKNEVDVWNSGKV